MSTRLNLKKVQGAYAAMGGLDNFGANSLLSKTERELVKIRASYINGCAYCVNMHSTEARKLGQSEQWISLMPVWREAGEVYTEDEKLIMKMTEEITLIHEHGLSDEVYEQAIAHFGEEKTGHIMMAVIAINAWNRIGVATNMHPALAPAAQS
jgi:AhpD family alkylhydroperoxidase